MQLDLSLLSSISKLVETFYWNYGKLNNAGIIINSYYILKINVEIYRINGASDQSRPVNTLFTIKMHERNNNWGTTVNAFFPDVIFVEFNRNSALAALANVLFHTIGCICRKKLLMRKERFEKLPDRYFLDNKLTSSGSCSCNEHCAKRLLKLSKEMGESQ